ncbi:MAG: threonylcarbamoyl-AMP synthase [Bdellovibrionales bacterium]|nr:threonylcarbamoyl-AMP synthase [Bdellovibrionales bacterium]
MLLEATQANILRAAEALKQGECIAFPTETVYGLGANVFDNSAIEKIFKIKGRPADNPLIVHISSLVEIEKIANLDQKKILDRLQLLENFWPGPLSVILPKSSKVSNLVTAGLDTVGVRMPSHPVAIELIKVTGFPLAAPSANISNYVSPTTALHVKECLGDKVKFILDGGSSKIGIESTVINLCGDRPKILRPGSITKEQLLDIFPDLEFDDCFSLNTPKASPGMSAKHYSPRKQVKLLSNIDITKLPKKTALISFRSQHDSDLQEAFHIITPLTAHGDLSEAAQRLYSTLRNLDKSDVELIVIEDCPDTGIGHALQNRLKRACN